MSYLEQQIQFLKLDKRLLEINLKNGSLTQAEYQQHLDTLDDDSDKAETLVYGEQQNQKRPMPRLPDDDEQNQKSQKMNPNPNRTGMSETISKTTNDTINQWTPTREEATTSMEEGNNQPSNPTPISEQDHPENHQHHQTGE